jgi:opacity protein-like surface antigen
MRTLRLAAIALTCLTVSAAFAQKAPGGVYGELGYTQVTIASANAAAPTFKPSALRGIVGYEINRNFAVEGMLAFGIADGSADGTVTVNGVPGPGTVKVRLDTTYGVYAKAKAEVSPGLEVFGRLGFTKANYSSTITAAGVGSGSLSDSSDGPSWGLGASYAVSPTLAMNVDYMSYVDKNGLKATGPTFGVSFKF